MLSCASDAGIKYLTGTTVESVDIKKKTLKVASGGEDITYDKLIVATGSTVSHSVRCGSMCQALLLHQLCWCHAQP